MSSPSVFRAFSGVVLMLSLSCFLLLTSAGCGRQGNYVALEDDPFEAETTSQQAATPNDSAPVESPRSKEPEGIDLSRFGEVRSLFDGQTLSGWSDAAGGEPIGWEVKDGALALTDPENGKDIITAEQYTSFIFSFEFRMSYQCNSGVKYHIHEGQPGSWGGLEYQVQDDAHVEDGKVPARRIGSIFDVIAAKESSHSGEFPAPQSEEPTGEFRSGKIVVDGDRIEHWLDGELVLVCTYGSEEWLSGVAQGKFKNAKGFGSAKTSPILLQAHGYRVEYRNLTIQTLK
ncbi:MAG: DUF1080 domain-containing protein [Planctomycetia bacterium]|nr:DUF1080 domain-containing protein [Planctomycetia bacterium]